MGFNMLVSASILCSKDIAFVMARGYVRQLAFVTHFLTASAISSIALSAPTPVTSDASAGLSN